MVDGSEGAGRSPRRRLPWGFLGMLGLVIAIEGRLASHDLDFTGPPQWDWRVIGRAASRPDRVQGKELLFFGDSLVKFSLVPKVFQQRSGKVAYNFALHTGQTSSSYFMLRRALRAGAKPSAVVLDLTPHMFIQPPEGNKNLWAELLTPEECFDFARAMGKADFFARTMLEELLPSLKERHDIRANLLAALNGGSTSKRFDIPSFRRNWKLNDGAQLIGYITRPPINPDFVANSLYPKWNPHPVNVAYLDRFLGLAAEHKIPVYWLLPPIEPNVQIRTDLSQFDRAYTKFVMATQDRFPGTIVVDARHSGFDMGLFLDGVHLNRVGALKLSSALAEVIRKPADRAETPRWVNLNLAGVRDFDGPVEDVNQSILAVKAEADAAAARR